MNNRIIEERIIEALTKQEAKPPMKHELGGSYYYQCYWMSCNATVTRWMEYCPACGQRIFWDEDGN